MLYESVLLFGVVFIPAFIYAVTVQQRNAMQLREGLQTLLFFILGLYFIWSWIHGGQTLPMKTWRIKLVTISGTPVTPKIALIRYLLCWLWFLPGMGLALLIDGHRWVMVLFPTLNFILWATTAWFDQDRQFLHDKLAGTRLIVAAAKG